MKKRKLDIWIAQARQAVKALRFTALDTAAQSSLNREMLYFNNSRIGVIAVVILVLESINIINVLYFSKSGLTTANNRHYFYMYLILFFSALICLWARHTLRDRPVPLQRCYAGFTMLWVAWHAVLSVIDLRHNPNIVVFVTGILSMSLLIRLKPVQMLSILTGGLLLLLFGAGNRLSSGNTINAVIVTLITMLVFCSRYFTMLEELGYRQKMILQENHRQKEKQRLAFLSAQQGALLGYSREQLFIWDKSLNALSLSGGKSLSGSDKDKLLEWLADEKEPAECSLSLQMDSEKAPCEYLISSTPQLDCNGRLMGAAGIITKKPDSLSGNLNSNIRILRATRENMEEQV